MNFDDDRNNTDQIIEVGDVPEEEEEEVAGWPPWYRPVVVIAGIIFVLSLVAVPALRIAVWNQGDDDPPSASERLRANAATIFTASVLERGSTDLAMNVSVDSLRDDVEALVEDANARGSANSRVTLVGSNCVGLDQRSEQCFSAELVSVAGLTLLNIKFGVATVGGSPRIIDVIRGESRALFAQSMLAAGDREISISGP